MQVLSTRRRASGMLPDFGNRLLAPDNDSALIAPISLSALNKHHVAPPRWIRDGRFVRQPELLQGPTTRPLEIVIISGPCCAPVGSSASGTSLVNPTTR